MTTFPSEEAVAFDCHGETLIGILHTPATESADIGVLIVVGGPQYRAGSHRQFTLLARALSSAGYPVFRFDFRGMGDSTGIQRSFEEVSDDIGAALSAGQERLPRVRGWVLWGLCDGASAALMFVQATKDKRVAGLCLVNPWVRSQQGLAKARVKYYYLSRFRQRDFWHKLLSGKVSLGSVVDLARNVGHAGRRSFQTLEAPSFRELMFDGFCRFTGYTLVVLSGNDLTAQEFVQLTRDHSGWARAMDSARVQSQSIRDADHTFSTANAHAELVQGTLSWLDRLVRPTQMRA